MVAQSAVATAKIWTISQWKETELNTNLKRLARRLNNCVAVGVGTRTSSVENDTMAWKWLETFRHVNVNVPSFGTATPTTAKKTARLLAGFVGTFISWTSSMDPATVLIELAMHRVLDCLH